LIYIGEKLIFENDFNLINSLLKEKVFYLLNNENFVFKSY